MCLCGELDSFATSKAPLNENDQRFSLFLKKCSQAMQTASISEIINCVILKSLLLFDSRCIFVGGWAKSGCQKKLSGVFFKLRCLLPTIFKFPCFDCTFSYRNWIVFYRCGQALRCHCGRCWSSCLNSQRVCCMFTDGTPVLRMRH